ncbi:hypothetical protein NE236_37310 [Actinoallomurus purpureus]|uniref:hypothetical protein n=1 Tax=Actinoallomurus purpureus TaxID=478114 RepID=UPI0020932A37|nr:hypothetical protein [Actinoallomurus purpureus]MCO6010631.1 hypothetical protein [Actinoallomurus purpureus]
MISERRYAVVIDLRHGDHRHPKTPVRTAHSAKKSRYPHPNAGAVGTQPMEYSINDHAAPDSFDSSAPAAAFAERFPLVQQT